ncbi:hypothetical protein [Rossellomorea aquimaris]|nr:hypothetical protein [Rossellomorea aquimaris]
MKKKKESSHEEYGQEFGDVNAAKLLEVTQKKTKSNQKEKKC